MSASKRRPYASLARVLEQPEVVSYLRVFDAWLAAGVERNERLVADLKDVVAQDLIGDARSGAPQRCWPSPERRLLADVLRTLQEEAA